MKLSKERQEMEQTKTLEYYLSLPYPIVLIPDEDGFWFAEIPLLKGCMTQGSSREEALEMLDEAKRAWLEVSLERAHKIAEPEPEMSTRHGASEKPK
jgi:antitoxin HicB